MQYYETYENCLLSPIGIRVPSLKMIPFSKVLRLTLIEAKATMYADDTAISYTSDKSEELELVINEELSCIERWLQGNKLSLNVVKT